MIKISKFRAKNLHMKKLINSILFLLVSLATFGQNKEIQTKNLMGLYYVSLGEGWINKNGMEIIPGPDHYVFIELKSDSTFIRTIVQEISHINHYEIGKWKHDGDTIFLITQHQKNTTKYILKWDDKFLNKKLKIYGLFSEKDGVIKNWTIIE